MNCKPGELAVVVAATTTPEMIGALVIVERAYLAVESIDGFFYVCDGPSWVCRAVAPSIPSRGPDGVLNMLRRRVIKDRFLRPIRDSDGQDETLSWAGLPQPEGEIHVHD